MSSVRRTEGHKLLTTQSFPNQDSMRAQLEGHLTDINRTADVAFHAEKSSDAIDLVVVTDSEAILGIGGGFSRRLSRSETSGRIWTMEIDVADQGVGGVTISTSKAALHWERASTRTESCRSSWM